jgi:hypothetical protein
VISIIALVFSIAGAAMAGVATVSVLSKKEKKQTRRIAEAEIGKAAPGLSVKHAGSADSAGTVADGSVTRAKLAPGVLASCPSGMTLVGAAHDLCIDSTDRATNKNWFDAAAVCRQAGYRLPSVGEALEAANVLNAAGAAQVFWTDGIFTDTGGGTVNVGWGYYTTADGISAFDRATTSLIHVRCVATPSDA